MESDTVVMQDIFGFDYSMGVSDEGRYLGHLKPTGLRPKFAQKLEFMGIDMPGELFANARETRR